MQSERADRQLPYFQYESCRGLEGWVTVCYNIDEIMELKYKEVSVEENVIGDVSRLNGNKFSNG